MFIETSSEHLFLVILLHSVIATISWYADYMYQDLDVNIISNCQKFPQIGQQLSNTWLGSSSMIVRGRAIEALIELDIN